MTLTEINKERNALQERRDNLEITLKSFIIRSETLDRLESKLNLKNYEQINHITTIKKHRSGRS